jgi:farnesyl-diphosphate farnesyltransferase
MAYCRYSASPVGRQLLDLHGESRETWPASDALCSALQVLNHLQDCADDYRVLDRVYLPMTDLAAEGIGVETLAARASCPRLRRVLDGMLSRTDTLVATARGLAPQVVSSGLGWECAVIVELARRLLRRLRRGDPLANRVRLKKSDFLAAFVFGVVQGFRR